MLQAFRSATEHRGGVLFRQQLVGRCPDTAAQKRVAVRSMRDAGLSWPVFFTM